MELQEILNRVNNDEDVHWMILSMELDSSFPQVNSFDNSIWGHWITRIEDGDTKDNEYISQMKKKIRSINKNDLNNYEDDPASYIDDASYESYLVSNNMYAALIVSIWSKCEMFLNKIIKLCVKQLGCEEFKKFGFIKQKNFFSKKAKIDIEKLQSYDYVNATRIMCNLYKHNNSIYSVKQRKKDVSDVIASEWKICEGKNIDFSKIPIKDIITHCRKFFDALCESVCNRLPKNQDKPVSE